VQGLIKEVSQCREFMEKQQLPQAHSHTETDTFAPLRAVEARGNVKINYEDGQVMLAKPLLFIPKAPADGPVAQLKDEATANAICQDVAEISKITQWPMIIEGHTKGVATEFGQKLADERARIVKEKVHRFGGNPSLVKSRGLPGKRGKNEAKIEIYVDVDSTSPGMSWNIPCGVLEMQSCPVMKKGLSAVDEFFMKRSCPRDVELKARPTQ